MLRGQSHEVCWAPGGDQAAGEEKPLGQWSGAGGGIEDKQHLFLGLLRVAPEAKSMGGCIINVKTGSGRDERERNISWSVWSCI